MPNVKLRAETGEEISIDYSDPVEQPRQDSGTGTVYFTSTITKIEVRIPNNRPHARCFGVKIFGKLYINTDPTPNNYPHTFIVMTIDAYVYIPHDFENLSIFSWTNLQENSLTFISKNASSGIFTPETLKIKIAPVTNETELMDSDAGALIDPINKTTRFEFELS